MTKSLPVTISILLASLLFFTTTIDISNFANAMMLEFKFNSYKNSQTTYYPLYARESLTSSWAAVCWTTNSDFPTALTKRLCDNMGYSSLSTGVTSTLLSTATSTKSVIGLTYVPQTGIPSNQTTFDEWQYDTISPNSACTSARQVAVRCSFSTPMASASRGLYLEPGTISGSSASSIANKYDNLFLRQLPNLQLQIRQAFSTEWYNFDLNPADYSMQTTSTLCNWLGHKMWSSTTYNYYSYLFNKLNATDRAPASSTKFSISRFRCNSFTATTTQQCEFDTAVHTSGTPVGLYCGAAVNSNKPSWNIGVPMALPANASSVYDNPSTLRITLETVYGSPKYVYILDPSDGSRSGMCYDTNTATASKLCEFAGFPQGTKGYVSSTTSYSLPNYWTKLTCPLTAKSINDCDKKYTSYCWNGIKQLKISCDVTESSVPTPAPTYSPSSSSSSSGTRNKATLPMGPIIGGVFGFVVIAVGIQMWIRFNKKNNAMFKNAYGEQNGDHPNNNQVTRNNQAFSNYHQHQEMMMSPPPHQHVQYQQPPRQQTPYLYSPNHHQGVPPPPPPPHSNFAPQMTTFDNVYQQQQPPPPPPPPPQGGSYMPGFHHQY